MRKVVRNMYQPAQSDEFFLKVGTPKILCRSLHWRIFCSNYTFQCNITFIMKFLKFSNSKNCCHFSWKPSSRKKYKVWNHPRERSFCSPAEWKLSPLPRTCVWVSRTKSSKDLLVLVECLPAWNREKQLATSTNILALYTSSTYVIVLSLSSGLDLPLRPPPFLRPFLWPLNGPHGRGPRMASNY